MRFCSWIRRAVAPSVLVACIVVWLPAGCSQGGESGREPLGESGIAIYGGSQGNNPETPWKLLALAANGPYGFATRDFVFVDETRTVPATASYPGAPVRTLPTRVYYPALPPWLAASPPLEERVPVAAGGPFPVLAYAHGLTSRGENARFHAEHLASHGYIVAAPLFPLSRGDAPGGPTLADAGNQPGDLAFVMNEVAQLGGEDADLAAAVDTQRRGILGLSLGGLTVILGAYHPMLQIPGIQAAVAHAPVSCFLGSAVYARPLPTLILAGTSDELVPPEGPELAFMLAPPPVILAELLGGVHSGFMNRELPFVRNTDTRECQALLSTGATGVGEAELAQDIAEGVGPDAFAGAACTPLCSQELVQTMGATRQLQLTRAATLAHFDAHLRGRATEAQFLTKYLDRNPDVEVFIKH